MFAEKLNTDRGYLVKNITVDESVLAYMMEKIVIYKEQKNEILNVCTTPPFVFL